MAEITLKYLHPSIKSYITTENYNYDTSVSGEVLFVADVFEHGKDNVIQQVTTLSEYLFKYGNPNYAKYGQAGYNVEKWLTNGGTACIMRLLPDNAAYSHAIFNVQYKNSTNGKTVLNSEGEETKIDDVYLRPLVAYIGVNKTSEKLIEDELAEDRSDYPTTDGYIDNFIFAVYPEGRGEYYNDLGFRIRLNPSYDTVLTSRVYTFEVIRYTSASTYDIIDGPYYVSFDPDAIDPNTQKSMFIENVINSYSDYIKVKFNTENYIKLANIINDEVDPYIIDVITGQSRILENSEEETFFSSKTGKDENVHISLHSYSSQGTVLSSNGNVILNISNNDESASDIVDIADNSRKVTYNNQYYITQYMRTFYNWLLSDKITQNLERILSGEIESSITEITGLLKDKADNLIYNNYTNRSVEHPYSFEYAGETKSDSRGTWYTKAIEVRNPSAKTGNEAAFSTSEMMDTITEDGYISDTNEHLISYYNNFMKYFQYIINFNVVNGDTFISGSLINKLNSSSLDKVADNLILRQMNKSGSTSEYVVITNLDETKKETNTDNDKFLWRDNKYPLFIKEESTDDVPSYVTADTIQVATTKCSIYDKDSNLNTYYYDIDNKIYIPITDFTLYTVDGVKSIHGSYIKVTNLTGDEIFINVNSILIVPKTLTKTAKGDSTPPKFNFVDDFVLLNSNYKKFTNLSSSNLNSTDIGFTINNKAALINTKTGEKVVIDFTNYYDSESYLVDPDTFRYKISQSEMNNFFTISDLETVQSSGKVVLRVGEIRKLLTEIVNASNFTDSKINNFSLFTIPNSDNLDSYTYEQIKSTSGMIKFDLITLVKAITTSLNTLHNSNTNILLTDTKFIECIKPLNVFYVKYEKYISYDSGSGVKLSTDGANSNKNYFIQVSKISSDKYYITTAERFNESFDVYKKYNKLIQAVNKVSSYAGLISKELDGKGKSEINDLQELKDINYSDFSLTTIFNFLVGGFESIVNNQGSITDYSNYASLKYLIKSINNKLDLRSTYLTILNIHKNNILDLSTDLAKQNVSVILGDETLDGLYSVLDSTVKEINYLITNVFLTLLNKQYIIQDLKTLYRYDKSLEGQQVPYARYFERSTEGEVITNKSVDPLGINQTYGDIGKSKDNNIYNSNYSGILPLLESCLIDLIGENHLGDVRYPAYGKQPLISIYNDIKDGYTVDGLTQEVYEDFYERLSSTLETLNTIHSLANAFVNEKYITEIIACLVGSLNMDVANIQYDGKSFTVNTLMDYYNQGLDETLTQEKVLSLINDSVNPNYNAQDLPFNADKDAPIYQYPYYCMVDIKDSQKLASNNVEIVKSNIQKQDHVLATLNTLCYDNLTQDINSVIGLAEGSDGDFTYDNSSTATLKKRESIINDIRIKAYKGTWNEDVLNKDLFEFDHIIDANYPDAVKNAIITLARDERQDFFYWADAKKQNTISDCIDWKNSFTNSTYFMSIISQAQSWYDEYTSKNIELTSAYLISDLLPRHISNYGVQYPMAGSRRGVVGGFLSMDWYPNETQKETLYKNKVNYIERDVNVIRIGSQNTNYASGPLGNINNMLVVLKIKRKIEKISKTYQFETNTEETRGSMNAEINNYLKDWVNNGACTTASAEVYASEYDIMQKIVRVSVILQFTGVIERIVINIDCPAK